jgi:hypothetical protein
MCSEGCVCIIAAQKFIGFKIEQTRRKKNGTNPDGIRLIGF